MRQLSLCLALLLVLFAPATGPAGFELSHGKENRGERQFVLHYHAGAWEPGLQTLPAVAFTEEAELVDPGWEPPPPRPPRESALLAIDAQDEAEEADWELGISGPAPLPPGAFTLREVRVGPVRALQVIADTGIIPEGDWAITVSGPGPAGKKRADFVPDEEPITRNLFLNGSSPVARAPGAEKDAAALPGPPAPWRLAYTQGRRAAMIALPGGLEGEEIRIVHQGRTLSALAHGEGEVLVYLPERTNITTDRHDVLFLSPGAANPSPAMAERPAFSSLTPAGQEAAQERRQLHRPRLIYERAMPVPIGDRFAQYRAGRGQTVTSHYPLPDRLTSPTLTARVRVIGLNTTANVTPDHHADFSLGGEASPARAEWKGRVPIEHEFEVNIDPSDYTGGAGQTIAFGHHIPAISGGPGADLQNLDAVEIRWTGMPRLASGNRIILALDATNEGPRRVTVGGLPGGTEADDILLLDITDDANPVRLSGAHLFADLSGTTGIEWEAAEGAALFLVELMENVAEPLSPSPTVALPAIPAQALEGIYVCPASLRGSLQPLLDLRGNGYIALDPEAAYDAYSHGQESPEAIRQAIAALVDAAAEAVPFPAVVLVGHASFDYRGYLGFDAGAQVPTFLDESIDTSFTIENCIDFPYGLLFGGDSFIDASVSRLPARTPAELDHMAARILAHEGVADELAELDRPAIFAYDYEPGILLDQGLFAGLWEDTGRPLQEVLLAQGSNGEAEHAQLRAHLEEERGASLVMYSGHGNNTVWTSKGLLRAEHIDGIDTRAGYPFVTTFTCLNAYYAFPGAASRSMAEQWLLAPLGKGAGASFAPCSVDYYNSQRPKIIAFLELLAAPDRPETTGGLVTQARLAFAAARPDLDLTNREYLLFGDAMTPTTIPAEFKARLDDWSAY